MRKHVKRQLIESSEAMEQATITAMELIEKESFEELFELLVQIQQCAIQVGTEIELEMGEGHKIVKEIENCCELLWQCSQGEAQNQMELCIELKKEFAFLKEQIQMQIKENYVIAFLPYKASMWDSLESVWREAQKEEDCKVVVMPIPYYDKLQDGTLGQMHYEGTLFPEDVPITSWEEFDLEEQHPDAIFIHNPYDDANKITSVHPYFYSKNLKQFTEQLAYIPYFIARGDVPKHYCVLPATIHAHKVFVQSEQVRKTYAEELKYICRTNLHKKVVDGGSPKVDKLLEERVEWESLPEQWKSVVSKADGRKIVLYNTHLSGLMKGNAASFLCKVRETIHCFYEHRDKVILLWRPHPLSIETAEALNPEVVEEYRKIIKEYKAAGFGIYDDSPELHRAIALSDAYYGDTSSIVELYKRVGKPILIQNINILESGKL